MIEIRAKGRGKVWERSLGAARRRVADGELYLLCRRGMWFRPGALGYTLDLADAGTFDAATARGYLDVDGLSAVPLRSVRQSVCVELAETCGRRRGLLLLLSIIDGARRP